ncbi:MAG: VPDSG-CTERM sorting domain-containing protein [Verrucomicrobia subdivision 3 bacterium]|nr:VPDSG-CTERM sorting domain-containing protein [Limisphaerales bacterium]
MMKKILALAVGAALLGGSSAMAITYQDNNPADVWLNAFNTSYSGQFTLAGYNPGIETITSAVATFKLNDAFGGREGYNITVEANPFLSGGSFATSLFGTITVGSGITGNILGILDATGVLDYTITRTSGEFWLTNARLVAQASTRTGTNPTSVPDGGTTLAMLGMGLVGVFGLRRKIA